MKQRKYIKNVANNTADFYVYGDIEDEKDEYWSGDNAIDPTDLKDELEQIKEEGVTDLNIMINSPGGSVTAASALVSLLQRAKQGGLRIHAFIDGLCASAATFIAMAADEINIYKNSIFMVHTPWIMTLGNADELRKDIEILETLENTVMLPLYKERAKVSEDEIKQLVADETWFNGDEKDELYLGNFFNVVLNNSTKTVAATANAKAFKNYKHVPANLINKVESETKPAEEPVKNSEEPKVESEEPAKGPEEKPEENSEAKADLSEYHAVIQALKHNV